MKKNKLAQHLRNNETKHIRSSSLNEENKTNCGRTTKIIIYENTEGTPRKNQYSNEQLVKLIQEGNDDLIPTLWEQVERFIHLRANLKAKEMDKEELTEDLHHEGFFALIKAIKGFNPSSGASFIHYLSFHLKNSFNTALGLRGTRKQNDPLHNAISFDIPLNAEENTTLKDLIVDPGSEEPLRSIEDTDYYRNIESILSKAITAIPNKDENRLLRYMFDNGFGTITVSYAGKVLGLNNPQSKYRNALKYLRTYLTLYVDVQKELLLAGLDVSCYGSSVHSYRRSFTSSVERVVLKRDRTRENLLKKGYYPGEIRKIVSDYDDIDKFTL